MQRRLLLLLCCIISSIGVVVRGRNNSLLPICDLSSSSAPHQLGFAGTLCGKKEPGRYDNDSGREIGYLSGVYAAGWWACVDRDQRRVGRSASGFCQPAWPVNPRIQIARNQQIDCV